MSDFFVVCECIVFLYFSLLFFHPFVTEMLFSKIEVGFDWTTDGARRCQHWKTLFLLSFFFDGLFTLVLVLFSIVSASPSVLVCSSLSKKSKSVGFLFSSLTLCQTVKKKKLSLKKTLFPTTTCLFRLALSLAFFWLPLPPLFWQNVIRWDDDGDGDGDDGRLQVMSTHLQVDIEEPHRLKSVRAQTHL